MPLVETIIGSMLHTEGDRDEWLSIQDSSILELEEGDSVLNFLKLRFDHLPNPLLKQCFAYCSIFPKGSFMEREQLIQLWMDLGFLPVDTTRNEEMEDVGAEFFKILLQNFLFQHVLKDQYGNIIGCRMLDLVHDLALSLSRFENLSLVTTTCNDIPKVRHLALNSSGEAIFVVLKEKEKARYLHTLFLKGNAPKNMTLVKFKCLRILNVTGSDLKSLPDSIGELKHLRYLVFSLIEIKVLPKSIGKLYNLQTLRLCECKSLKKFPKEVRNLRHLYLCEEGNMPCKVGLLTCLRTLPFFRVGREKGYRIEELGSLKHLRGKLKICNLEEVSRKEEAQSTNLVGNENLYELELLWSGHREGGNWNDKDVLEALQPHLNLKSLTIREFSGDNFPAWVMNMAVSINARWSPLHNQVEISLSGCKQCEHIPMLGQLPLLWDLELIDMHGVKCLDASFYGSNNTTNYHNTGTPSSSLNYKV